MANERPRYRIPETGAEIEYNGIPGPHMQPLNAAALAMFDKQMPWPARSAPTPEQPRSELPRLLKVDKVDNIRNAVERAKQFLVARLSAGPVASTQIRAKAAAGGHSWRTIQRAAKALGIEASKKGMAAGWVWRLPKNAKGGEDRHTKTA